jgi:NAD(P)-dependent dehydrogenase (short-subunit alcohol dehydrogenase family)
MSDRVALVTGAGRGIGAEVARRLGEAGFHVHAMTRAMLDVSDPESIRRAAAGIDRLDVLVNNAAGYVDWAETASTADLRASRGLFETNLFGTWAVTQAFLPQLRRSAHPRVVIVSSGAGSHGDAAFGLTTNQGATASYGISKAALNALTAKLAAELADTPILVNAVCPGLTATAPGMEAMGARPVADGARSVVWAALLGDDGPRGGFFRDGRPLPW